jgi:hypothetical protein
LADYVIHPADRAADGVLRVALPWPRATIDLAQLVGQVDG